jgi:3-oxoacyl-[acyl-carrier-protein] synthase II
MRRRVVITGLGTVTGLGIGARSLWEGLCAGKSALGPLRKYDASGFRSSLGAEVPEFAAKDFVPKSYRKAVKVMARDVELAVAAAKLAVEDANLATRGTLPEGSTGPTSYPGERMGCHVGAALIAAETEELTTALVTAAMTPEGTVGRFRLKDWGTMDGGSGGMNNLPPLWMLKYLPNMLACHVTIIHGCEGPSNTITCAEASGLLSIGESARVIERDAADLCFSGGAESNVNFMRTARLDLAGRLAPTTPADTDGSTLVRPYDPDATGGMVGESGGIVILEEAAAATARGARVLAEVAGFGAAHSAPPAIPPYEAPALQSDEGLEYAISAALDDAGISASEIDAILPHASGIRWMDAPEAGALRRVFGARLAEVPLVTLTPMIGDCLAGNGGVMASVASLMLSEQRLPARLHAGRCPADLRAQAAASAPASLRHVLVCTSSLGGQNAAVVVRRA